MRSLVADTVGEPSEVLHLQTRPIPEPGPGQVRIRVAAVPVHASDLHTIRGRYGFTPSSRPSRESNLWARSMNSVTEQPKLPNTGANRY
jgi:NADPH:quinone reductase-like Zn-dependent oxidoreductase